MPSATGASVTLRDFSSFIIGEGPVSASDFAQYLEGESGNEIWELWLAAARTSYIVDQCIARQLLINCTHGNVIRLLPALNLSDEQLHAGCDILEAVLLAHKL